MAELKTKPTSASVKAFLDAIPDPARRTHCKTVARIMRKVTGKSAKMWGPSIVGFGTYHYTYASGHEGDCFLAGFAPRKGDLTLYIMSGFGGHAALMKKLGRHKTGKSCLYIRSLDDVDLDVLTQLIERSVKHVSKGDRSG